MITLKDIVLQRGVYRLLDNANGTVYPQRRVGIIGANGCGKSSLFQLLLTQLTPDGGSIDIPRQWRIAHMAQEVTASGTSAVDYVIDGDKALRKAQHAIAQAEATHDNDGLAKAYADLETLDGYSANHRAEQLLHGLGFTQSQLTRPVKDFSGGWRIRLNLAQALMCPSDLLLLDEPTNHLDLDATLWLEQWLSSYPGTLLFISHDRDFIDNIADDIFHIDKQLINHYSGNYSAFERQRAERLAQQQASFEKQQQRIKEVTQFINRFKAKATKAKQAQSRVKELARMEKIAPAHIDSPFSFNFAENNKAANPMIHLHNAAMGYGEHTILSAVNFSLQPGMRLGLLGFNGAGKSTFIKSLVGDIPLLDGEHTVSEHLQVGYFAQHQLESLDLGASAILHLQRLSPTATEQSIRDFLGGFNFHGEKALEPIAPFSGGEKARLALAIIVWQKPNVLLLDEPTNHLDLDMRHALTVALQSYNGALVVISHDRHLLKNTVDEFYLIGDGKLTSFKGDLGDYQRYLQDNNNSPSTTDNTTIDTAVSPAKIDKKMQRQQEASRREKLRPITNQLKAAEKTLERAQTQLTTLETQLADENLYTENNKATLKQLLDEQITLRQQIAQQEDTWLALQETLDSFETTDD